MTGGIGDINPYRVPDQLLWTGRFLKDINMAYAMGSQELVVYDEASIESMLENIWLTMRGERPFEPTFGSHIPALLWEPCDATTAWYIESEIFDCTGQWIPYIAVDYGNTRVTAVPDSNLFKTRFAYQHLITGLRRGFTLNLVR